MEFPNPPEWACVMFDDEGTHPEHWGVKQMHARGCQSQMFLKYFTDFFRLGKREQNITVKNEALKRGPCKS